MGADGPGAGAAQRLQPLGALALSRKAHKPPDVRLYGRLRGPQLRGRQLYLLEHFLPQVRFPLASAPNPKLAFPRLPDQLWLEVGAGGGEHAVAQAAAEPGAGLIACEVFTNGICSLLSRLAPDGTDPVAPPNLMVWDQDARILLQALPPGSLDRLFLLFPDPWPKARHIPRRFAHPGQLPMLARAMRPGAEWRIATDDPTYQAWVAEVLAAQALFDGPPPVAQRPSGWPPTRYEAKALRAGRAPLYWSLHRTTVEALCSPPPPDTPALPTTPMTGP